MAMRRTHVARSDPNRALTKCGAGKSSRGGTKGRESDSEAGVEMSFINSNGLDDLAKRLADSVPESLRAFGRDLEGNFKAVLQAQLAKLDLVTRQDFDVQAAILERTQAKLTAIDARLKELETKLSPQ
jgi:ubiquinone biosynthesis accessory factor UbiK